MEQIDDRQVLHIQEELIRKYRNKIESQRRMIHRQEKVIEGFRQQYLFLYREQFRDISRLLFGWNFLPPHQLESKTLYLRVERMLERLQGGADGMGDIPESINFHFDRILDHLREDFPNLKPIDYRLFCYLCAGFSCVQIKDLLGLKSLNNLYLRKNRLIQRIRSHSSPWRKYYLMLLSR